MSGPLCSGASIDIAFEERIGKSNRTARSLERPASLVFEMTAPNVHKMHYCASGVANICFVPASSCLWRGTSRGLGNEPGFGPSPRLIVTSSAAGPQSAWHMSRRAALLALGALAMSPPARAAMYSSETSQDPRYAVGKAADSLAKLMPQINDGYTALVELSKNWEAKTAGMDGDVVRRIIGTVGLSSPLFNIRKTFLRAWQIVAESGLVDEETIDRMETEWNGVLDGLSSVDFQAYSVGFTELQETKQNLLASARAALDKTIALYKEFIDDLPIQLQHS